MYEVRNLLPLLPSFRHLSLPIPHQRSKTRFVPDSSLIPRPGPNPTRPGCTTALPHATPQRQRHDQPVSAGHLVDLALHAHWECGRAVGGVREAELERFAEVELDFGQLFVQPWDKEEDLGWMLEAFV